MTHYRKVDSRGTVNLPAELRRGIEFVEIERREDGVLELRPRVLTDPSQTWFWGDRWQSLERDADLDIRAGRVKRTDDVDEFLRELETPD